MRRFILIVLIGMAILTALGILLPGIQRAREEEEMRRCQNHLRQIGSFAIFHSTLPGQPVPLKAQDFFPSATIMNADLQLDQRLSWYVLTLSALDQGPIDPNAKTPQPRKTTPITGLLPEIDVKQAWNAGPNAKVARARLSQALCPAQFQGASADEPALCNYLGNGGIGNETPTLALDKAGKRAGVFRYESPTPLEAIANGDGASNSISFIETTTNLGPWMQGGLATIRCLDPDKPPFLGPGKLYSGCHHNKGNYVMADGSLRVITDSIDPQIFRALLTNQGGETQFD